MAPGWGRGLKFVGHLSAYTYCTSQCVQMRIVVHVRPTQQASGLLVAFCIEVPHRPGGWGGACLCLQRWCSCEDDRTQLSARPAVDLNVPLSHLLVSGPRPGLLWHQEAALGSLTGRLRC